MFQKCEESWTYLALPWSEEQNQGAAGCGYTVSDSCSYFPLPERVPESESPYARVPVFPLISKQDAKTLVKPKKDMQKQTKQRKKEPLASKESRFSCKKKQVQEVRDMGGASATCNSIKGSVRTSLKTYVLFDQAAAKASAQSSKKKLSSAVNSERPNKRRHPPAAGKGKTQARVSVKSSPMLCAHSLHISSPFSAVALSYRVRGFNFLLFFFFFLYPGGKDTEIASRNM